MRYIYLPGLFDEHKCCYRFGYCLKEYLDGVGIDLERFDYRGTGENKGDFCDVTWESLVDDVEGFIDGDRCVIIGVRMGGSIGVEFCCNRWGVAERLILVEPIIDGSCYVRWLEQGQAIKNTISGYEREYMEDSGYRNIEGYKTSEYFLSQLERFSLLKKAGSICDEVGVYIADICGTGGRGKVSEFEKLLKENSRDCIREKVDSVQFWRRVAISDYSGLIQKIGDWCNA